MKILLLGATSLIAQETAKHFALEGAEFYLVGKSSDKLEIVQRDLLSRGAKSAVHEVFDFKDDERSSEVYARAKDALGEVDLVYVAYGILGDQKTCEEDYSQFKELLNINFLSVAAVLTSVAHDFEERGDGQIAVISSVAGDRGRTSNYAYGVSKGALDVFLQGLRNRLSKSGVQVLTIKPGFVDTPMTQEIEKNFLFASAEVVGKTIHRSIVKKRNVVYVPWFWWGIMFCIRAIPECIFKKLKL